MCDAGKEVCGRAQKQKERSQIATAAAFMEIAQL
jgi:hypothetical protein